MDNFYLIISFFTLTVKGTSSPESWALSSCTESTSWTKSTSGAPIKSWINSFVPTLDKVNRSTYEACETIKETFQIVNYKSLKANKGCN